jgi:hypothetical protein
MFLELRSHAGAGRLRAVVSSRRACYGCNRRCVPARRRSLQQEIRRVDRRTASRDATASGGAKLEVRSARGCGRARARSCRTPAADVAMLDDSISVGIAVEPDHLLLPIEHRSRVVDVDRARTQVDLDPLAVAHLGRFLSRCGLPANGARTEVGKHDDGHSRLCASAPALTKRRVNVKAERSRAVAGRGRCST